MNNSGVLPHDVVDRVRADFARNEVDAACERLLAVADRGHVPRILRCIVHLAAGDIGKLAYYVDHAEIDTRDLMYWAEYDATAASSKAPARDFNQPMALASDAVRHAGDETSVHAEDGSALCA